MNEKHLIWAKKQYEKISDLQHDLELLNNDEKNCFYINITIDTRVANEQFKSPQLNNIINANVKKILTDSKRELEKILGKEQKMFELVESYDFILRPCQIIQNCTRSCKNCPKQYEFSSLDESIILQRS
ncbi:MAG: hypothetical protein J6Q47_02385 [Paludibacteraceae bacterium]|nr:hypothetical protein [Paludibacteraceae bacterium]